jgi:DmsE family decaheme c-type cytochrome
MAMRKNPDQPSHIRAAVTLLALIVSFTLAAVVFADEGEENIAEDEYSNGARQCMSCHKEGKDLEAHEIFMTPMGISDAPDSPFAAGSHDCESCHGPSKTHRKKQKDGTRLPPSIVFNDETPADVQNEVCESCHKDNASLFHWSGSMHDEEEVACASCHEVHAARDPVFDSLTQQEACFSCHPRTRAQTLSASSHPLRFGKMACSDCHDPHNGNNDFLLKKSTVNETCYTCHAEKRGPFLFEHAPVTEDCSLCHNSHGSNHADLLTQRAPLLCQQCHSPAGHPSVAYTSEVAENSFQQRFLLGQSCSNCHAQVHGSNHPSGVTLTR